MLLALILIAAINGYVQPLDAVPGPHDGVATIHGEDIPFAYRVPPGYDPHRPAPLVILAHGHGQSPADLVTLPVLAALADHSGAILLAPGGDDADPAAVTANIAADEEMLGASSIPWDHRRRYLGGYSNGAFDAFHALVALREPCAGFLAISGVMLKQDTMGVRLRLQRTGAYFVVGSRDPVVTRGAVRANVQSLRAGAVFAHYYEEPGGTHAIDSLVLAIAKAWTDMLAGVTRLPVDGLGPINES